MTTISGTVTILSGTSITGTFSGMENNSTFIQQRRNFRIADDAGSMTVLDQGP